MLDSSRLSTIHGDASVEALGSSLLLTLAEDASLEGYVKDGEREGGVAVSSSLEWRARVMLTEDTGDDLSRADKSRWDVTTRVSGREMMTFFRKGDSISWMMAPSSNTLLDGYRT